MAHRGIFPKLGKLVLTPIRGTHYIAEILHEARRCTYIRIFTNSILVGASARNVTLAFPPRLAVDIDTVFVSFRALRK